MTDKSTPVPAAGAPADRLAISALLAGIVAFLGGWLPVLGLFLGAIGLSVSVIARRRSNRPAFALTGLILSIIAIVANIVIDIIVIVAFVNGANSL